MASNRNFNAGRYVLSPSSSYSRSLTSARTTQVPRTGANVGSSRMSVQASPQYYTKPSSKSLHTGTAYPHVHSQQQPANVGRQREEESPKDEVPLPLKQFLMKWLPQWNQYFSYNKDFKDQLQAVITEMRGSMVKKGSSESSQSRMLEEELEYLKKEKYALQNELLKARGSQQSTKDIESNLKHYHQENQRLETQVRALSQEKNDLLKRLSRIAGTKLSDNNPNLTDLSDPNRPQKLAEKYSQLYDDKWSDALEQVSKIDPYATDRKLIDYFLNIFQDCYRVCKELSENHLLHVIQHLLFPTSLEAGNTQLPKVKVSDVSQELSKGMKEARKLTVHHFLPNLYKKTEKTGPEILRKALAHPGTEIFTKACLELCWYCVVQDPPVVFKSDVRQGSEIDLNYFRHYDRSGKIVEYLVWPAMLLHDGGPVLCKGVVQPTKK